MPNVIVDVRTAGIPILQQPLCNGGNIMQATERKRLVSTLSREGAYGLGTALKCSICLAILILLIAIGNSSEHVPNSQAARKDASPPTSVAGNPGATAHRRQVFEERRAKFLGKAPERDSGEPLSASRAAAVDR